MQATETEAIECAAINSIRGRQPDFNAWRSPPFRSPHHSASPVALVGGGNPPKPGEISLAHHGVLFMDELPEFQKKVLETLREPIESGIICISRAGIQTDFPAKFQLVAAMNPCPCDQWGNPKATCRCTPEQIRRYLAKLSAPLLDRIDLQINVQALSQEELIKPNESEGGQSAKIREQVETLRLMQIKLQGSLNAELEAKDCEALSCLGKKEQAFLAQVLERFQFSGRSYHRLLKVARTIADREGSDRVSLPFLQQALSFKQTLEMPK